MSLKTIQTENMQAENKETVRRMVEEVQNGHALERMDVYFDPNFTNHLDHAPGSPLNSVEKAKLVFGSMFTAFPDLRVIIQSQMAEGDRVVTHKIFRGTHRGKFMGAAPTGKSVEFAVIDILRLEDGKIVEHWAVQDRLAMMQQLGLVPAAG